ncbi:RNA-directed DNA polymerase, eukaryota [Tanacetum coccineum]
MNRMDLYSIKAWWGNLSFDYAFSPSVGFFRGDFNDVRLDQERFGTVFNAHSVNAFNNFITMAGLVDLHLKGYSYTWTHKYASKMSKLDRFLIIDGLLSVFPSLSPLCLDRHLSDHRLILMRELDVDYGPTPFQIYHSYRLCDLEKMIDQGRGNEGLINDRSKLLKELQDLISSASLDVAQKAKICWSIKGDENSKYFHGVLNKKRFSNRTTPRLILETQYSTLLSLDQKDDLERNVSYDEIKRAVWDCGTNKSPGPNGFTFQFFRRYWYLIDQDVVDIISDFFSSSKFPQGCNSSFITLIPKTPDAKVVKDFRPISLIGNVYKIIAKILANRLSLVILDLISDVQSTFVSNRQILDDPFILNELLSWCKYKKIKAMIFKVDFEKAFDSVRCFFLASGLKINLNKSKLMGIGIPQDEVIMAADYRQKRVEVIFKYFSLDVNNHLRTSNNLIFRSRIPTRIDLKTTFMSQILNA